MAFIIIADQKSHEIDRRELVKPVVIGRSPECEVPVRDILLSRRHCLFERIGENWVLADLNSKNGTRVNGELISRHVLQDADIIRIGRTRICYSTAAFVPAAADVPRSRQRPADPLDAMAGTLAGFKFNDVEEEALDQKVLASFPRPRPHPAEPRAFQNEKVQAMLTEITSSAWDSILMQGEYRSKSATGTLPPKPRVTSVLPVFKVVPAPAVVKTAVVEQQPQHSRLAGLLISTYLGLSVMVAAVSVWVISWSW